MRKRGNEEMNVYSRHPERTEVRTKSKGVAGARGGPSTALRSYLAPLRSGCLGWSLRHFLVSPLPRFPVSIAARFLVSSFPHFLLLVLSAHAFAAPSVVSVENGGLLFTDNPAGVSGTDAGFSAPIGDKTLWLFGDVFLLHPTKPEKPYVGGVSNCGLLVGKGKGAAPLKQYRFLTDAKTGLARQLIPLAAGEKDDIRLWPGGSWYDGANKRLYLYYAGIKILGEGTYNFKGRGQGLCVADVSKPESITFERLRPATGEWMWPEGTEAVYGNATLDAGEWLYVYGSKTASPARLARVRKAAIADLDAYEYFSGTPEAPAWSRNPKDATDVDGLRDFPSELTVAYNRYLSGYLAVHNVILDDRIRLSLAPNPWGPFTKIADIGAPRQAFTKSPCYAGKEHPELAEDGGRVIYITYVDQQRYWLQLLKVTLKR
jgi:hypothetical protein